MFDDQKLAVLGAFDGYTSVVEETVAARDLAIQVATQKIGDLQTQLDVDVKERQATELLIADLRASISSDNEVIAVAAAKITALQTQLAQLGSVKVYDRLDDKIWGMNSDKAVGGSGLGTSAQSVAGIETAEFSIKPQVGQYFDVYCHLDFPVDDLVTKYRLETDWMFPTAADAAASQCLEMEARQVFNGHMFIVATQLMFNGNHLRYWDAVTKWTPSTSPMPRLVPGTWYHVVLEGHRDAMTVYHDAITINGMVTKLGTQYQAQPTTWRTMLRCALQLDGNSKGDAYRAKRQNTKFTVSN